MDSRFMLACELLTFCPSDLYPDFCRIADAIEGGEGREDILDMPEVKRWPETFMEVMENTATYSSLLRVSTQKQGIDAQRLAIAKYK